MSLKGSEIEGRTGGANMIASDRTNMSLGAKVLAERADGSKRNRSVSPELPNPEIEAESDRESEGRPISNACNHWIWRGISHGLPTP